MRLKRRKISPSITLPTIADIAMLLLIFFVLCGQIGKANTADIHPPRSLTADRTNEQAALTVAVTPDGAMFLEGRRVEMDQLKDEMEAQMSRRVTRQERTVQIEVDKQTPYRAYVQVVDVVNHAKGYVQLRVLR